MNRACQAVSLCAVNFRMWKKNPRIAVTFALGFILCFVLTQTAVEFAREQGVLLQVAEPFIWTFSDGGSILCVSLLLVLLFADMPFISQATPFFLSRSSRAVWLSGQILYVSLATLLFVAFILVSTCALCAHLAFAGNQWSEAAAMLGYSGAGKTLFVPASVKTMETTSPYACMAQIFLLMLGYTLVLVCVMLAFNVWKGTIAGMLGALGYSLAGLLLTPRAFIQLFALPEELYYRAVLIAGWVSPLNQATYQMHNFGYDDLPTLSQTYLVFSVAALLLCAVSLRLMRRYSFTFTGARS